MESHDDEVAVLAAERAITRVLHSYAQGYDQGRLEQVRACYWDDATDEHTDVFSGTVDDYVQFLSEVRPRSTPSSHFFMNVLIDVDLGSGTAEVVSDCLNALMQGSSDGGGTNPRLQSLRYIDFFERREGEWRILRRVVLRPWTWLLSEVNVVTDVGGGDSR
jgi:hypothetical protein